MIKIIDSRLKVKVCPWAITQRQNTSTDLIDTRRRRISSLQPLSLTGIRLTCVTFLDTHHKENFSVHINSIKMRILFFHIFLSLNAYNTFTEEEKEIERLFGKWNTGVNSENCSFLYMFWNQGFKYLSI